MIGKMLMKDPNHRYADCGEIIRDLGGLGLANPALSFIETAGGGHGECHGGGRLLGQCVSRSHRSRGPGGPPAKLPPGPGGPLSSAEDAARTASKGRSGKTWFVQHKGADGKVVISKMSTAEIMAGIKGEYLDLGGQGERQAQRHVPPAGPIHRIRVAGIEPGRKGPGRIALPKNEGHLQQIDRQDSAANAGDG